MIRVISTNYLWSIKANECVRSVGWTKLESRYLTFHEAEYYYEHLQFKSNIYSKIYHYKVNSYLFGCCFEGDLVSYYLS